MMTAQTARLSSLPHLFVPYLGQLPLKYSSSWLLEGLDLAILSNKNEDDIVEAHCYVEYKVGLVNFRAET